MKEKWFHCHWSLPRRRNISALTDWVPSLATLILMSEVFEEKKALKTNLYKCRCDLKIIYLNYYNVYPSRFTIIVSVVAINNILILAAEMNGHFLRK